MSVVSVAAREKKGKSLFCSLFFFSSVKWNKQRQNLDEEKKKKMKCSIAQLRSERNLNKCAWTGQEWQGFGNSLLKQCASEGEDI